MYHMYQCTNVCTSKFKCDKTSLGIVDAATLSFKSLFDLEWMAVILEVDWSCAGRHERAMCLSEARAVAGWALDWATHSP